MQNEYAALLADQMPWIRSRARSLARRDRLDEDEEDDFVSYAIVRLMEDDYSALRKFRGEAALSTYLTVVLSMLYRDYRVSRWGRWRPSPEARRRGPLAIKLESLLYRDGLSLAEASQILRSSDPGHPEERELARLAAELTGLPLNRRLPLSEVSQVRDPSEADVAIQSSEAVARREAVESALNRAVAKLSVEDAVIVRMRFNAGMTIASIARALGLEQKPLYRRIERIFKILRAELANEGVNQDSITQLLTDEAP